MTITQLTDGETDDQPSAQALSEAASAVGMTYAHIPVKPKETENTAQN